MSIYTRTGDDGTTSLLGGKRILKSDLQVEAYGSVDELSSVLGMIISAAKNNKRALIINTTQKDLYYIMSFLAGGKAQLSSLDCSINLFEHKIDKTTLGLPKLNRFILPQGDKNTTLLHFARTICRRSERAVVLFAKNSFLLKEPNILLIIKYLNRLSDLLFTLARQSSHGQEVVV